MKKNVIGLIRVSTRMQGESRNGLDGQRAEIIRWVEYNNYNLVTIMEEVASGSLPLSERPILQAALSLAKKMKSKIVVTRVDRASRREDLIHDLMQVQKRVTSIELGEQADPFVEHIAAGLAARELRVNGARTRAGMAAAKARGVVMGNRVNLAEAQAKGRAACKKRSQEFAAEMRPVLEGMRNAGMTYQEIATKLNKLGTLTPRVAAGSEKKSVWHGASVRNILMS